MMINNLIETLKYLIRQAHLLLSINLMEKCFLNEIIFVFDLNLNSMSEPLINCEIIFLTIISNHKQS